MSAGWKVSMPEKGCEHIRTQIWEPHLAGARKCWDCKKVYNPNCEPQWFWENDEMPEKEVKSEGFNCANCFEPLKWGDNHKCKPRTKDQFYIKDPEPKTYRFGEFELTDLVKPVNAICDWYTTEDWVAYYNDFVKFNWNSPWIKKPKEPLRAEFEAEWNYVRYSEIAPHNHKLELLEVLKPFIGKRTRVIIEELPEGEG